jgi:hypothetical protein
MSFTRNKYMNRALKSKRRTVKMSHSNPSSSSVIAVPAPGEEAEAGAETGAGAGARSGAVAKGATRAGRARKGVRKCFSYEFNPVKFPAHKGDVFRATVTSVDGGVVLWLESKKTKQQWQATVSNVADCGPAGVPEEAVFQFMKVCQPP